jgi:hypothetical protein
VPRLAPFCATKSTHAADGGISSASCGRKPALFVTDEEAAEIYARARRSWYGANAKSVVEAKIQALAVKGDHKGVEAWKRVARALARQEGLI